LGGRGRDFRFLQERLGLRGKWRPCQVLLLCLSSKFYSTVRFGVQFKAKVFIFDWFSFASLVRKWYGASMKQNFKVTAIWDPEAEVFTSTSNIPGLVVEAETFEEFVSLVEVLAPEMLEANLPSAKRPFLFDIELHRTLAVA
jgi:Domain of unknown function (DUF1902)